MNAAAPLIVALPEEIDITNSVAVRDALLDATAACSLVIADMTGTTFCDCSAVRALLTVCRCAHARGATLRIAVTPGSAPARVMALVGAYPVLPVYPCVGAALPAAGAREARTAAMCL